LRVGKPDTSTPEGEKRVIALAIPGWGELVLRHLVLDLNGTLAVDGQVLGGVTERVSNLASRLEIHLISADTRGLALQTAQSLHVHLERVEGGTEDLQKLRFVQRLGADSVAAIGNGANDALMLCSARLGIAILGGEGLALAALTAADVVVSRIEDALDLLLLPQRLIATLRH